MTVQYYEGDYELQERMLPWQRAGLQETATGYGAKLTSYCMARLADGRLRRVYVTCYGNIGSTWITLDRQRLYLRGY